MSEPGARQGCRGGRSSSPAVEPRPGRRCAVAAGRDYFPEACAVRAGAAACADRDRRLGRLIGVCESERQDWAVNVQSVRPGCAGVCSKRCVRGQPARGPRERLRDRGEGG